MDNSINNQIFDAVYFIKSLFKNNQIIPLHEPRFLGNEKNYLIQCIDSTFVSSVGKFVDKFEEKIAKYTGAKYAISTSSGTSALHISLILANVDDNSEVITQSLNFVAACNAIKYCNGSPIFLDVDIDTMGLSPSSLKTFLHNNTMINNKKCINKKTNKIIKACIPMHTFGHPNRIDEIKAICNENYIFLIEDAAESLGSFYKTKHTGSFGHLGAFSFNGNKIITSGGGGCIITNNKNLAIKAKHLTTTAKVPHKWDFNHDKVGYNYRMPNLNASLLLAQLENLDKFIKNKRILAKQYSTYFKNIDFNFFEEPENSISNYWLNSIILKNKKERDLFLEISNKNYVMTRPIWILMNKLKMFKKAQCSEIKNSIWLSERLVNLPSSVRL